MQDAANEVREWLVAVAAALTATFTGLHWYRTRREPAPVVEAFVRKIDGRKLEIEIRVHNRASQTLFLRSVTPQRPRGLVIKPQMIRGDRKPVHSSLEIGPMASVSVWAFGELPAPARRWRRTTVIRMSIEIASSSRTIRRKLYAVTGMEIAKTT